MVELAVDPAAAPTGDEGTDEVLTRILDAAGELFARHGVRRTSMDDVARRAGVGRNTVFRRLGSKDVLVGAVLGREMARLLAELDRVVTLAADPLDRLTGIFAVTVTAIRAHPMRPGIDAHPEETAELTAFGDAEFMRMSTSFVAGVLAADAARGDLSPDLDLETLAETVVRLVHSVLLVPHLARPLETDAQLRAFAGTVLRPHLG